MRFATRVLVQAWWFELVLPRIGLGRLAARNRIPRLVKVAHWSTQEANRERQYQLWATSGTPYIDYKVAWDRTRDLRTRINPLLDDYYAASLQRSVEEVKKYRLVRREVSIDGWLEPKYLQQALKELQLEDYWPQQDADGKVKVPGRKLA